MFLIFGFTDLTTLQPSAASTFSLSVSNGSRHLKVDTDRHLDPGPSARNFRDEVLRLFMGNSLSDPEAPAHPICWRRSLGDSCASTSKNRKNRLRCPVP